MKPPLKTYEEYDEKKDLEECIKCQSKSFEEKQKGWLCLNCKVFYDNTFFFKKPDFTFKNDYESRWT